jgi:L-iditol 2-dehydrogenase
MADVVIEATGRPEAVVEGLELCRDGGTYVVVGQYTDNGNVEINPHLQINRKHIVIKGSWGSDFGHFYRGVQFMAKMSHLPWDLVVSRAYHLKDAREALASVEKLEVFKALITPNAQ